MGHELKCYFPQCYVRKKDTPQALAEQFLVEDNVNVPPKNRSSETRIPEASCRGFDTHWDEINK